MALYKDGNPVSGINSIPRLTLAQYNALNVKPEFWVRTDAPESYKKLSADQVSYDSNNTVKDKIDSMPLNAWGILYNRNVYSASETELTTELSRSITKYPLLAFTFVKNGIARDSILIPSDLFASGTNVDLSYVGGASDRHSITISYNSDSSVKVVADQNNGDYKLFAYALAPSTTF